MFLCLPNNLARDICLSDGYLPWKTQHLSILLCMIVPHFFVGISQIFLVIMSFHALQTCLQLSRLSRLLCPIIINISSKMRSGNPIIIMISRICFGKIQNMFSSSNHLSSVCSILPLRTAHYVHSDSGCSLQSSSIQTYLTKTSNAISLKLEFQYFMR